MRTLCVAATAAILALAPYRVMAAEPRLFAVFKRFCIDTGADPQAARAALQAAGGISKAPTATTDAGGTTTNTDWTIALPDGTYAIGMTELRSPHDVANGVYMQTCNVHAARADAPSLASARAWMRVQPSQATRPSMLELYYFSMPDRTPLSPKETPAFRVLQRSGKVWSLLLLGSPSDTSLVFQHMVPLSAPH